MADLDRWIEGLNRPDLAEALARQREHRNFDEYRQATYNGLRLNGESDTIDRT